MAIGKLEFDLDVFKAALHGAFREYDAGELVAIRASCQDALSLSQISLVPFRV